MYCFLELKRIEKNEGKSADDTNNNEGIQCFPFLKFRPLSESKTSFR